MPDHLAEVVQQFGLFEYLRELRDDAAGGGDVRVSGNVPLSPARRS